MVSSYSASWPGQPSRLYWLPPGGMRNGLNAQTWAPLIDVDAGDLIMLLDTLRQADIAAYGARVGRLGRGRSSSTFRVWVDTWTHARAEDVAREVLLRHHGAGRGG